MSDQINNIINFNLQGKTDRKKIKVLTSIMDTVSRKLKELTKQEEPEKSYLDKIINRILNKEDFSHKLITFLKGGVVSDYKSDSNTTVFNITFGEHKYLISTYRGKYREDDNFILSFIPTYDDNKEPNNNIKKVTLIEIIDYFCYCNEKELLDFVNRYDVLSEFSSPQKIKDVIIPFLVEIGNSRELLDYAEIEYSKHYIDQLDNFQFSDGNGGITGKGCCPEQNINSIWFKRWYGDTGKTLKLRYKLNLGQAIERVEYYLSLDLDNDYIEETDCHLTFEEIAEKKKKNGDNSRIKRSDIFQGRELTTIRHVGWNKNKEGSYDISLDIY